MVSPVYAALLGLIFIGLSVNAIKARRRFQIAVGDGGNDEMLRAARVHGNFAEYAPLALLLIFMLEMQTVPPLLIHALCTALVLGRLSHAFGVRKVKEDLRFRIFGMVLTFVTLAATALALLLRSAGIF